MSFQFFHRVSDGFEFFFVRVDFLRLRFDGVLELRLGGFLGGLDETFPEDELARLRFVEKRDFAFGFFSFFEAFLLLLLLLLLFWSSFGRQSLVVGIRCQS